MDKKIPNSVVLRIKDKIALIRVDYKNKVPVILNLDKPLLLDAGDGYFSKMEEEDIAFCSVVAKEEKEGGKEEGKISVNIEELIRITIGKQEEDGSMEKAADMYENCKEVFSILVRKAIAAYISGELNHEMGKKDGEGEKKKKGRKTKKGKRGGRDG